MIGHEKKDGESVKGSQVDPKEKKNIAEVEMDPIKRMIKDKEHFDDCNGAFIHLEEDEIIDTEFK
jgi:hypothetical protein